VSGVGSTEPPRSAGAGFAGAGAGIWEVFRQERKGVAFEHAGSVAAPDETFAQAYAHEQYGRRGESVCLWVVPRGSILEVEDFVDELNRNYHRVDGYSLKAKLKEARERAGTAAPGDR
jgi:phenylacetate-CoA oxygenase PaaH subunit